MSVKRNQVVFLNRTLSEKTQFWNSSKDRSVSYFGKLYCLWYTCTESLCQWEDAKCVVCRHIQIGFKVYTGPNRYYYEVCNSCKYTLFWMEEIGAQLFYHLRFAVGLPRGIVPKVWKYLLE